MKTLRSTIIALTLTMMVSSTALAGNIGGLRSSGNIGGLRNAGTAIPQGALTSGPETNRFNLDVPGSFAGLLRMLLDAGALL